MFIFYAAVYSAYRSVAWRCVHALPPTGRAFTPNNKEITVTTCSRILLAWWCPTVHNRMTNVFLKLSLISAIPPIFNCKCFFLYPSYSGKTQNILNSGLSLLIITDALSILLTFQEKKKRLLSAVLASSTCIDIISRIELSCNIGY